MGNDCKSNMTSANRMQMIVMARQLTFSTRSYHEPQCHGMHGSQYVHIQMIDELCKIPIQILRMTRYAHSENIECTSLTVYHSLIVVASIRSSLVDRLQLFPHSNNWRYKVRIRCGLSPLEERNGSDNLRAHKTFRPFLCHPFLHPQKMRECWYLQANVCERNYISLTHMYKVSLNTVQVYR